MGLSSDLRALGEVLAPEEAQHGDPEVPTAFLDPRLRTTYSPRVTWGEWRGFAPAPPVEKPREWARLWDPAEPDELGSSLAPNPKRPPRYGLQGMPPAGRRNVWRALALLEEMRPLLSFWTVSLPPEALGPLAKGDALPTFQDRLRKELVRQLGAAGLPSLVVGVVELQPQRSKREGRPVPHWHLVFQGRRDRQSPWALSREVLDGVILSALQSAGIFGADLTAAGNVQGVRRSVRAYLSKYMTKGSGDVAPWLGGPWEALLPRQWWFWSAPLRLWVLLHVLPLAFPFLLWVHARREPLQALGLLRWRVVPLPDSRAPLTVELNWLDCGKLARLVALWLEDSADVALLAGWEAARQVREWFSTGTVEVGENGQFSTGWGKGLL